MSINEFSEEKPYTSNAAAAKAAVTIALNWQQDKMPDEDYHASMGEIVKHHPLALIYVARYAALGLMTASEVGKRTGKKNVQSPDEMWQHIASQLDMDEEED